jgi:hypothetical protein
VDGIFGPVDIAYVNGEVEVLFGLEGIHFVSGDTYGMLKAVGIDFYVCLLSTLGINCVTGDVNRIQCLRNPPSCQC